uniref:Uncharacterized protein n=1 Tax=Salix viminalis TaxID=40686 RepID=A0A6N2KZY4_SALVM
MELIRKARGKEGSDGEVQRSAEDKKSTDSSEQKSNTWRPNSAHSVSGKRKRKLLKISRREQKEAVEKGLVTMQDVEMAFAQGEGTSKDVKRTPAKFKKGLKLKQLKRKGKKNKTKPKQAAGILVDAMAE